MHVTTATDSFLFLQVLGQFPRLQTLAWLKLFENNALDILNTDQRSKNEENLYYHLSRAMSLDNKSVFRFRDETCFNQLHFLYGTPRTILNSIKNNCQLHDFSLPVNDY